MHPSGGSKIFTNDRKESLGQMWSLLLECSPLHEALLEKFSKGITLRLSGSPTQLPMKATHRRVRCKRLENPRLSKPRPSVYITFVRAARIASPSNGELEETVWLQLRNNTGKSAPSAVDAAVD
jgi:hypothetical protein